MAASVSTTAGGVPRVWRTPGITCTAAYGGTRTSTEWPGARSSSTARKCLLSSRRSALSGSPEAIREQGRVDLGRVGGAETGRHQQMARVRRAEVAAMLNGTTMKARTIAQGPMAKPLLSSTIEIPITLMVKAEPITTYDVNRAMPRPAWNHRLPMPLAMVSSSAARDHRAADVLDTDVEDGDDEAVRWGRVAVLGQRAVPDERLDHQDGEQEPRWSGGRRHGQRGLERRHHLVELAEVGHRLPLRLDRVVAGPAIGVGRVARGGRAPPCTRSAPDPTRAVQRRVEVGDVRLATVMSPIIADSGRDAHRGCP